jgi:hypothetical protein
MVDRRGKILIRLVRCLQHRTAHVEGLGDVDASPISQHVHVACAALVYCFLKLWASAAVLPARCWQSAALAIEVPIRDRTEPRA